MSSTVRDVMTSDPVTMSESATIVSAAQAMRDADIGAVIVMRDNDVSGILTDRDTTVRAVAEEKDPHRTTVGEIYTRNPTTVSPSDDVDRAVELMREQAVRRLPVVENGKPVGIVSIGDLALDRDPRSALADISAAPPNN
jgi:CBS domain-containing protein